ncbi:hypothetical protein NA57DRAFT_57542 [Rhizodiscina lignyota]|uniref:Uncharacterized protein n=1 Tax=Rhizodiscina lignyota TaxID=1504668 RepID=A0A9P4IH54_9PEZI|nr:hypothetical protein NA57DRAFT_57542 [Rhizodiscina lignyota]
MSTLTPDSTTEMVRSDPQHARLIKKQCVEAEKRRKQAEQRRKYQENKRRKEQERLTSRRRDILRHGRVNKEAARSHIEAWKEHEADEEEKARARAAKDNRIYQQPDPKKYASEMQLLLDSPSMLLRQLENDLKAHSERCWPFLLRAVSRDKVRGSFNKATKGHTSLDLFQPSADNQLGQDCHGSIFDMTVGEVLTMVGHHLLWKDRNPDEFLSFSISMLFVIEHALGRSRKDQFGCFIMMMEPKKATTTATRTSTAGRPAPFYGALELLEVYGVRKWEGWGNEDRGGLHPRKFTHEWLLHGNARYTPDNESLLTLDELKAKGLFRIYPEFAIPRRSHSTNLYERLVALRRVLFDGEGPQYLGIDEIEWAADVARGFVQGSGDGDVEDSPAKAPLHAVLMLIGLRKRPQGSQLLIGWIRANYTVGAYDLEKYLHPHMHQIADNLPEVEQYLNLVRDACTALNTNMIPDTILDSGSTIGTAGMFLEEDQRLFKEPRLYFKDDVLWAEKEARKKRHNKGPTLSLSQKVMHGMNANGQAPTDHQVLEPEDRTMEHMGLVGEVEGEDGMGQDANDDAENEEEVDIEKELAEVFAEIPTAEEDILDFATADDGHFEEEEEAEMDDEMDDVNSDDQTPLKRGRRSSSIELVATKRQKF